MNFIGEIAALATSLLWTALEGKFGVTIRTLRAQTNVTYLIALGALVGPLLGVSASLLAVQHAEIGVASALMAWTKSHTFFC